MHSEKRPREGILDPSRGKTVRRGPEEMVRQRIIAYMTETMGVPLGLIAVEKEFDSAGAGYRADVVAYSREGNPWMVVECKAPSVTITQQAFDQIGQYNRFLNARYLLVTNGREHYCCEWNVRGGTVTFLDHVPTFPKPPSG